MDEHNIQDKRKTSTFTLRIDDSIIKSLQKESELYNISLNTLINKILTRYIEWDSYAPKVGMIPMAKPIIASLFNMMNEEEIIGEKGQYRGDESTAGAEAIGTE